MRKIGSTAFCLLLFALASAQNTSRNLLYLEAGGSGLFGSINYERQLTKEPGIGARIGIGFYTENALYVTIPVGVNLLFKLKNERSFIDAGLAATWTRIDGKIFGDALSSHGEHFVNFIPAVGYRRHTATNIMWRVALTPAFNKYGFVPWLGASIGKTF